MFCRQIRVTPAYVGQLAWRRPAGFRHRIERGERGVQFGTGQQGFPTPDPAGL
jgi:hypothetical protein